MSDIFQLGIRVAKGSAAILAARRGILPRKRGEASPVRRRRTCQFLLEEQALSSDSKTCRLGASVWSSARLLPSCNEVEILPGIRRPYYTSSSHCQPGARDERETEAQRAHP